MKKEITTSMYNFFSGLVRKKRVFIVASTLPILMGLGMTPISFGPFASQVSFACSFDPAMDATTSSDDEPIVINPIWRECVANTAEAARKESDAFLQECLDEGHYTEAECIAKASAYRDKMHDWLTCICVAEHSGLSPQGCGPPPSP